MGKQGVHEDAWKGLVQAAVSPTLEHAAKAAVIAAMVMGHSIKQWDLWSDMQYLGCLRMQSGSVTTGMACRLARQQCSNHTPVATDLTFTQPCSVGHVLVSIV